MTVLMIAHDFRTFKENEYSKRFSRSEVRQIGSPSAEWHNTMGDSNLALPLRLRE